MNQRISMKTKNIILIAVTALILIIVTVRETGLLELDLYKSKNRISATDDWTEIASSEPKNKDQKIVNKNDLSILILQGKDTLYKQINKFAPIMVTFDTLDSGPLWLPLYKSTKYSAIARTSLFEAGFNDPSNHGTIRHLEGQINLNGELTITGFCSSRTAKRVLRTAVVKNISEKVISKFAALPEDFFTGR